MNKNQHILSLVLLLVMITIQDTYAQKKGSKRRDENALKYSYQHPERWKGLRFSDPKTFFERSYFSFGMKINEIWGISDIIDGSTIGINSVLSFGHWIAPVHGLEVSFGIGAIPYASWELNNQEQGYFNPYLTKYWYIGLNYMLHLSSYAAKLETPKPLELLAVVGVSLRKYEKFSIETNIGMRLRYNFQKMGIGIYLEPSMSLFNNKLDKEKTNQLSVQVTPSISAGMSIHLDKVYVYNKQRKANSIIDDDPKETFQHLSIKTNILYWTALIPNVGLEYHFRKPWSVGGSVSGMWWKNEATHSYFQIGIYELEGRYYLGKKRRHHFGVYVQGGMYDLEFNVIGKIGEFIGAGMSYGYTLPINNYFSLDFEIGAGYTNTVYEEYQYAGSNNIYEYLRSRRTHLFSPSKVGVSLVWSMPPFKKWNIPLLKKKGGLE